MTNHTPIKRSSYTLPADLLERAMAWAKPLGVETVNSVLQVALEEFIARREQAAFEASLSEMAADPDVQAENRRIATEFASADPDGLL